MICTEVGCDPTQGLDFRGFSRMVDDEEAGSLASSRARASRLRVFGLATPLKSTSTLAASCFFCFCFWYLLLKFVFVSF